MKIGYARVSTEGQIFDRQIDALKQAGCVRIYCEKVSSRKKERPELTRMIDTLRAGDIVIIEELTRLGRSVRDLISTVDKVHTIGAHLISLQEPWMDTTSPQGTLLFTIFAAFAQFERDLTRQRVNDGLQAARARGHHGGRPTVSEDKINLALKLYDSKQLALNEIVKASGVSKATLYRRLSQRSIEFK